MVFRYSYEIKPGGTIGYDGQWKTSLKTQLPGRYKSKSSHHTQVAIAPLKNIMII